MKNFILVRQDATNNLEIVSPLMTRKQVIDYYKKTKADSDSYKLKNTMVLKVKTIEEFVKENEE